MSEAQRPSENFGEKVRRCKLMTIAFFKINDDLFRYDI
jgi:hypothetical protein